MWWIPSVVLLALGGVLAASRLIVTRQPDAQRWIDKIAPLQGVIGVLLLIWGLVDLVNVIRSVGLIGLAPLSWLIFCVTMLLELGLGFLLGFPLIERYVLGGAGNVGAQVLRARDQIAPAQGLLGVVAIMIALLFLIHSLRS